MDLARHHAKTTAWNQSNPRPAAPPGSPALSPILKRNALVPLMTEGIDAGRRLFQFHGDFSEHDSFQSPSFVAVITAPGIQSSTFWENMLASSGRRTCSLRSRVSLQREPPIPTKIRSSVRTPFLMQIQGFILYNGISYTQLIGQGTKRYFRSRGLCLAYNRYHVQTNLPTAHHDEYLHER